MINEYFYGKKYDSKIVMKSPEKEISLQLLKKYISYQIRVFKKNDIKNVVISDENNLDFIVNFFAAVFSGKTIYLLNKFPVQFEVEYFMPQEFEAAEEILQFEKINPDKVFINFFTSGSTAQPKIIKKTLTNLINEQRDLYKNFHNKLGTNTIFVSTSTMTHMFCLTFQFMLAFFSGFIIDIERVLYPEELENKKNFVLISTPSFLDRITDYQINPCLIITAGSKLKNSTYQKIKCNIIEIYGSTETGVIAYKTNCNDNFRLFDSVKIVPQDCNIKVKSDYFIQDEMILNDSVEMISDKEFILKDRTDRLAKINDKRVSLCEIENILQKHKFIDNALCLKYDEKLCGIMVLTDEGKDFLIKNGRLETIKILKRHISQYSGFIPKKWRFLCNIPLNRCGKTDWDKIYPLFDINYTYPLVLNKEIMPDKITLKIVFTRDSNFFKGHFDDYPILAGIVQIFFANHFIENMFNIKLAKNEIKKIKFTNLITPDTEINLVLKNKNETCEFTYTNDEKVFSSGIFLKENA